MCVFFNYSLHLGIILHFHMISLVGVVVGVSTLILGNSPVTVLLSARIRVFLV